MNTIGKIVDSFTMQDTFRVLVADQDCSGILKIGDTIQVTPVSGAVVRVTILDAFLDDGAPFGLEAGKQVSSIRVDNKEFGQVNVIGGSIARA